MLKGEAKEPSQRFPLPPVHYSYKTGDRSPAVRDECVTPLLTIVLDSPSCFLNRNWRFLQELTKCKFIDQHLPV